MHFFMQASILYHKRQHEYHTAQGSKKIVAIYSSHSSDLFSTEIRDSFIGKLNENVKYKFPVTQIL